MIQDFYDIRYSHFYLNSICIKYRFRFLNNHLILQDGLIMSTITKIKKCASHDIYKINVDCNRRNRILVVFTVVMHRPINNLGSPKPHFQLNLDSLIRFTYDVFCGELPSKNIVKAAWSCCVVDFDDSSPNACIFLFSFVAEGIEWFLLCVGGIINQSKDPKRKHKK